MPTERALASVPVSYTGSWGATERLSEAFHNCTTTAYYPALGDRATRIRDTNWVVPDVTCSRQLRHEGAAVSGTQASSCTAWEAGDAHGHPPHPHGGERPAGLLVVTVIDPPYDKPYDARGVSATSQPHEPPWWVWAHATPGGPIVRAEDTAGTPMRMAAICATGQRVAAGCGAPGKTHPDHTPKPADHTC